MTWTGLKRCPSGACKANIQRNDRARCASCGSKLQPYVRPVKGSEAAPTESRDYPHECEELH